MKREEEIRQEMSKIAGTHPDWTKNDCMRMGFREGAKWADEHPNSNGKELLYVAQKTADRTKKEFISKACEWLLHQEEMIGISFEDDFIERFKEAMEL